VKIIGSLAVAVATVWLLSVDGESVCELSTVAVSPDKKTLQDGNWSQQFSAAFTK
jgi:hypothetical protein